jgi:hypothetical protein
MDLQTQKMKEYIKNGITFKNFHAFIYIVSECDIQLFVNESNQDIIIDLDLKQLENYAGVHIYDCQYVDFDKPISKKELHYLTGFQDIEFKMKECIYALCYNEGKINVTEIDLKPFQNLSTNKLNELLS